MKNKNEKGLLSLEAVISLTIFIFLMLFLYSFFVVFEARNAIAHSMLSTANSMAFDAFKYDSNQGTVLQFEVYEKLKDKLYQHNEQVNLDAYFTDDTWVDDQSKTDENGVYNIDPNLNDAIKNRFTAYITGGKVDELDKVLKRYHIKDGKNGLDFSQSYISNSNIYIVVTYTMEYEFKAFGFESVELTQSCCSRLWKTKGD